MRRRKIYLNLEKTKYAVAMLFKNKKEMRDFYSKHCPNDKNHNKVYGVSVHRDYYKKQGEKWILTPRTGEVLLNLKHCGAGIVSHEFMHAVLWAYKHNGRRKQYPFVIKNIKEEEKILHNLTFALQQFYNWYWKVKDKIK